MVFSTTSSSSEDNFSDFSVSNLLDPTHFLNDPTADQISKFGGFSAHFPLTARAKFVTLERTLDVRFDAKFLWDQNLPSSIILTKSYASRGLFADHGTVYSRPTFSAHAPNLIWISLLCCLAARKCFYNTAILTKF